MSAGLRVGGGLTVAGGAGIGGALVGAAVTACRVGDSVGAGGEVDVGDEVDAGGEVDALLVTEGVGLLCVTTVVAEPHPAAKATVQTNAAARRNNMVGSYTRGRLEREHL